MDQEYVLSLVLLILSFSPCEAAAQRHAEAFTFSSLRASPASVMLTKDKLRLDSLLYPLVRSGLLAIGVDNTINAS